ncbi:MAG TPA: alpha/beta fold hydrolase [Kineosporiaceae bacterium]|nr:alpha/beta fold hydrolase [Kineosporiaceae bacterium]
MAAVVAAGLITGSAALISPAQALPDQAPGAVAGAKVATEAVTTGALTATGATTVDQAAAFTPKPISWHNCVGKAAFLRKAKASCAELKVPRDWSDPNGTTIKLWIARVKHTVPAKKYQGVMLTSAPDPGASGLWLTSPAFTNSFPAKVTNAYDWIGYAGRGIGTSRTPALHCDSHGFGAGKNRPDYRMTTAAQEKVWRDKGKAYAKDCDRKTGPLLDHMKTRDTVNDLETLRKALGVNKINFYGFSYGGYVGEVYSTLHPTRIRRMVLDSPLDPARLGWQHVLDQNLSMETSIKVFFTWMAKHDASYHFGNTEAKVEARYYEELNALDVKAAPGGVGSDELNDVFLAAVYNATNYPYVAGAFADWVNDGDSAQLKDLYKFWYGPSLRVDRFDAVHFATYCTGIAWPAEWTTWRADSATAYAAAPFATYSNTVSFLPCHYWAQEPGTPVSVNGAKVPAALLVNETLNGESRYADSLAVRALFPQSRLVEGVGGTLANSSMFAGTCIDKAVARYLLNGTLPARSAGTTSDQKCKPYPAPKPLTASAAAAVSVPASLPANAAGRPFAVPDAR